MSDNQRSGGRKLPTPPPEPAPAPAPGPTPFAGNAPAPATASGQGPGPGGRQPKALTRALVLKLLALPEVKQQALTVAKHIKIVDLMRKYLGLAVTQKSFERCWTALDAFLVGRPEIDSSAPTPRFNRVLRTINFCIDLYDDHVAGRLPAKLYLLTRQQLINPEHADKVEVGRYRIPMNGFREQSIHIRQENGEPLEVRAVISLEPPKVYATRMSEVKTLFGRLVKAQEVQRIPHLDPPIYAMTGNRVVLKYFEKHKLGEEDKSREDPFKEIVSLQYLRGQSGFPVIQDVLENSTHFIKVESDCGTSLFDLAVTRPDA